MKRIGTILLTIIPVLIFSQNNLSIAVEFANQLTFKEIDDSLRFVKQFEMAGKEIRDLSTLPKKQKFSLKGDSIVIESFFNKNELANDILVITNKSIERLDVTSGSKMKWFHPLIISRYRKFKNYNRISNEDKNILGYDCKAFMVTSKYGWHKIWISDIKLKNAGLELPNILINRNLILKRIVYSKKDGRLEDFEAVSIINNKIKNLNKLIEEHLVQDIKDKYLPISENTLLSGKSIKKGDLVDNYKFRNVFKEELINLHDITSLKEFTILEFWGTWCLPCLLANEKIQELKKLYGGKKLSIVSINVNDRNNEKLKNVIQRKRMDWKHGYATNKIVNVFNKKGTYPKLVLLNSKNKVLFIGNPQVDLDKIKSILNQ